MSATISRLLFLYIANAARAEITAATATAAAMRPTFELFKLATSELLFGVEEDSL